MNLPPLPDVKKLCADLESATAALYEAIANRRTALAACEAAGLGRVTRRMRASAKPAHIDRARLLLALGGHGYRRGCFSSLHLQNALATVGVEVYGLAANALFTDLGYRCIGRTRSPDGFTRVWVPADQPAQNPTDAIRHLIP